MSRLDIEQLRGLDPQIVCLGSYRGIVQSILDFDFLAGRTEPSIVAITATGRKSERYFFGQGEVTIPVVASTAALPKAVRERANLVLNLSSGRRVLTSMQQALADLPNLVGGAVFAEGVPERHALELQRAAETAGCWLLGPASVGLVLPGVMKLGAIGGTEARQLEQSRLTTPGHIAVVSSSGGMVNEIIRTVAVSGRSLSYAIAIGGERWPLLTPVEAVLAAQADPATKAVAYFGELGGRDEYDLAAQLTNGSITKPVVAYIAGSVAEVFATPPQFGHAKAMAGSEAETARAKAAALRKAGVQVATTYGEFVTMIGQLPGEPPVQAAEQVPDPDAEPVVGAGAVPSPAPTARSHRLVASTVSGDDEQGNVQVLGEDLLELAEQNSFAKLAVSMLLGHKTSSRELEEFVDFVLRLLVDHGPYVSGAMNTIVTARAGRDLVSSLAAGLLTIGPRFGGAINQAAATWLRGVNEDYTPAKLVEELASRKEYISGIGHRKYRVDLPDPRVGRLLAYTDGLDRKRFTTFALGVEAETLRKKGNLILNVDGAIAAVLLDLLSEKEDYNHSQLRELVETEFFNALFVAARSIGFMAHYFDQRRLDEGLFRLPVNQVAQVRVSRQRRP